MFEILADRLSLEIPVVEDFILDNSSVSLHIIPKRIEISYVPVVAIDYAEKSQMICFCF